MESIAAFVGCVGGRGEGIRTENHTTTHLFRPALQNACTPTCGLGWVGRSANALRTCAWKMNVWDKHTRRRCRNSTQKRTTCLRCAQVPAATNIIIIKIIIMFTRVSRTRDTRSYTMNAHIPCVCIQSCI